jgi:GNAT superfamily N-acetyltransferase
VVPRFDPGRLYQWGTLVLREHRGRRLGQATKAYNLLWVQRELSGLKLLVTYNAEVNRHMIAVNEAMGFRPVERLTQYQRPL